MEKKQFADNAAIVTGRIISNQGAPEVMFVLKTGETMKAKMYGWRPRDLKQDDVVEIVYSLKDPQKIELESNLWTGQLVIAILALASTVIGWLTRKGIMVAGPLKQ